jgi:hypothetical protein
MPTVEKWILFAVWVITFAALYMVPHKLRREAHMAFLAKQVLTWLLGLIVVQYGWIAYPVRLLAQVNGTSLTFEYFVYPGICVYFHLYFPVSRGLRAQLGYYAAYTTGIVILEVLLEKYTDLIEYIHWTWYWSWITVCITFYLSRVLYVWFFAVGKTPSRVVTDAGGEDRS